METLFIAFNDETDSARTQRVREQLLANDTYLVSGYAPYTTWAKSKSGDSLKELRADFDRDISSAHYVIILLGEDCATNPWIRYAIERSYVLEKPMFALNINMITDEQGNTCARDINPLERFAVLEHGRKIYLSDRYQTYDWDENLAEALPNCLARAEKSATAVAASKRAQQTVQSTNYRDYESMRFANSAHS